MKRPLLFGSPLLLLTLAACGETPSSVGGASTLTRESAVALAASARAGAALLGQTFQSPADLNGAASATRQSLTGESVRAQAFDCSAASTPTRPVDADADLVPASANFVIDCAATDDRTGAGVSLKGSSSATDKNDADPRSGFAVRIDNFRLAGTDGRDLSAATLNYTFDLSTNATGYAGTSAFSLDTVSPQDGAGRLAYNLALSYRPDDAARPRQSGTWNGSGNASSLRGGVTLSLSATATDLHYNAACAQKFDRGTLTYTDERNNTLRLTYTGCTTISYAYNGQTFVR